ncbi:MAG: alpha/beta fold hydrolase, partial [Thermosynechococcaceae cyanobacterium]
MKSSRIGTKLNQIGWSFIALLLCQGAGRPVLGAERVFVNYSLFGRSVSVPALETFVRDGKLTGDLISYARFLKPKQLVQLREGLQQKVDFSAIALSQFFYTPTGELLLGRVSQIIQPPLGRGSLYALRSALIQAANDPDGLTPLSFLRNYPNPQVIINLEEGIGVVREVNRWVKQTETVSQAIQIAAAKTAETTPLSASQVGHLMALQQPGPQRWQKLILDLQDASKKRVQYTRRVRKFAADVYLPMAEQPHPVVLISHGLNSDRQSYAYLAEYLASYGFAVVVPEHPGSSKQQIQALIDGRAGDVAEPSEFLDRPLDIQFVLDSLQGLSQEDARFRDRLNLQQVGLIGQSFGGYTALVSAGAPLELEGLKQQCNKRLNSTLNLSLILKCQALRLPVAPYRLADSRIKAAIAVNPIISGLLGPTSLEQIQVPVMVVAGSADVIATAL